MPPKHYARIAAIAACLCLLHAAQGRTQNNYPHSGDALIHGLTIGTGNAGSITNTALGDSVLKYNKGGINNTGAGMQALYHNSSGQDNTALGSFALTSNFSGGYNLAAGYGALSANYSGSYNVALGPYALSANTGGSYNTAVGDQLLTSNTNGLGNTAVGVNALYNPAGGIFNSALGEGALQDDSSGNYNTGLGAGNRTQPNNPSNATAIAFLADATASNSVVFGDWDITSIGGYTGWTNFSDGRYKKNVSHNVPGLAFIKRLEPITYTLDVDGIAARLQPPGRSDRTPGALRKAPPNGTGMIVHTGFIAQDVEKTAQSFNYNFSGVDRPKDAGRSFYGLRYSDFVVPLVKAMQELSAEHDRLQAANARLSEELDRIEEILITAPSNNQNN
jgi:hypothetical protein